jgi:hypothetical protein
VAARGADAAPGEDRETILTGIRTWLDPVWRSSVEAWVAGELTRLGRSIAGPIEQPHVRPWATTMRIPMDGAPVWFKATGPGPAYEGPLLEVLRAAGVERAVLPLAVHPTRPWLLFDDAGPTLRARRSDGRGDHDLAVWERILTEYATLQRSVEGDAVLAAMLAAGTPDERPERLAEALDRLVADDRIWSRVAAPERALATSARARLASRGTAAVTDLAGRAARAGVPASIQHNDFHGGNIVVGPDGDRFFDWGDAVIGHPFATLAGTFASIVRRTGRDPGDPAFERLHDAYFEAWTDVAPRTELDAAIDATRALAPIGKALAWERALMDLEPDEMDGHAGRTAEALMSFAERLDAEQT